eukprot:COSAG01_NODE_7285_length_3271_cov_3.212484_4_plen_194_part_00
MKINRLQVVSHCFCVGRQSERVTERCAAACHPPPRAARGARVILDTTSTTATATATAMSAAAQLEVRYAPSAATGFSGRSLLTFESADITIPACGPIISVRSACDRRARDRPACGQRVRPACVTGVRAAPAPASRGSRSSASPSGARPPPAARAPPGCRRGDCPGTARAARAADARGRVNRPPPNCVTRTDAA